MLKILFAGFKYEYGRPQWGLAGIEYRNFLGTLEKMQNVSVSFFAVDEIIQKVGRDEMNKNLVTLVEEQKPDLLFTMIFQEEIKKETIEFITTKTATKTFNWFTDDHWRLSVFSRYWAPLFTMVGTTDSQAPEKYRRLGITNIIKTQWGVNHFLFKPQGNPSTSSGPVGNNDNYNITFAGTDYGKRSKYIRDLQRLGLPAQGFGKGWQSGMVDQQKMMEIFSFSKISLNFTESAYVTFSQKLKLLAKMFIKKEFGHYRFAPDIANGFKSSRGAGRRQIKGRNFEIPACGGFLLTGGADNLSDYYVPDKEIVVFESFYELAEKCKYYLAHGTERAAIAKAGYERTIREHTYERRFSEIFKKMGF